MKLLNRRYSRPKGPRPKPQRDKFLQLLVQSFPRPIGKKEICRQIYGSAGWYEVKRVNTMVWMLRKEPDIEIQTTNPKRSGLGTVKLVRLTPELRKLRHAPSSIQAQAQASNAAQRQAPRLPSVPGDNVVPIQQPRKCAQTNTRSHETAASAPQRSRAQGSGAMQQELRSRPSERRDTDEFAVRRGRSSAVRLVYIPGRIRTSERAVRADVS
jgi:hypothetical protein